jgi:hypothetical protein
MLVLLLTATSSVAIAQGLCEYSKYVQCLSVNSTGDLPELFPGDGVCITAEAECTLRAAIEEANATPVPGTIFIGFSIPGPGPHTITPQTPLPTITYPVTIDGYTETGASPNTNGPGLGSNAVLMIEVDGSLVSCDEFGLHISAGSSTVRGLVIHDFPYGIFCSGGGILLSGAGGNKVEGNFLGTDVSGTSAVGDAPMLISGSPANVIGGTTPAARNVISGNWINVGIRGPGVSGNRIEGNLIGTNASGTAALGGSGIGVGTDNASGIIIGGSSAAARNVISGHSIHGMQLIFGSGNTIQGNYIGTDVTGTSAVANGLEGVNLDRSSGNIVEDNLISGNTRAGVGIGGTTATGNVVRNNLIGTDVSGTSPLGNSVGVGIGTDPADPGKGSATDNTIGPGNAIAYNGDTGITVFTTASTDNAITGNSIHSNGNIGIDLSVGVLPSDGVTLNDVGDGDTGANNFQNFPVLTATSPTTVSGSLNSTPNTTFALEFFSNSACDPSGHGEGETPIGLANVTTDGTGEVFFSELLSIKVSLGSWITATATGPDGTSEFSACTRANDRDGDGITDDIDLQPLNPVLPQFFSDVPLGGMTRGVILSLGDQVLTVSDEPSPDGIRIRASASGGPQPAVVSTCAAGTFLLTPGDEAIVTCSSVTVKVISGPIEATFTADDGSEIEVSLEEGAHVTFDPETGEIRNVVNIDIKPGSEPNCFNNDGHGVIPVAILSSATFDATRVDPASVALNGQSVRIVGKSNLQSHIEDVDGDGLNDLVVQIEDTDGSYQEGDSVATLTGVTTDGVSISGTDSICIVP